MDTDQCWGAGKLAAAADASSSTEAAAGELEVVLAHYMPRSAAQRAALFPRCSEVVQSTATPEFRRPVHASAACDKAHPLSCAMHRNFLRTHNQRCQFQWHLACALPHPAKSEKLSVSPDGLGDPLVRRVCLHSHCCLRSFHEHRRRNPRALDIGQLSRRRHSVIAAPSRRHFPYLNRLGL